MEAGTKGTNLTIWETGKGNFITKREVSTTGNGKIIICMDMGNSTTQTKRSHMKDSGIWTNFMGKGKYIMTNHNYWRGLLIIATSKI